MSDVKKIQSGGRVIRVVSASAQKEYISERDAEMDIRAQQAVKAAVSKAEIRKKPIAKYDATAKKVYLQYPDGRKVDVR